MAWDNLVVAVHVSSKRLIWRAPWQEWPSMRPGTTDIAIRTYRGYNDFTMQDWQGFNLVWPIITSGITKSKNPPTDNMVDTLKLSRDKCVMGWNWLNLLHSLQKTTLPMIPGIEIGKSKKENCLLADEKHHINRLIQTDLSMFWDRIWQAHTQIELQRTAIELRLYSHNTLAIQ